MARSGGKGNITGIKLEGLVDVKQRLQILSADVAKETLKDIHGTLADELLRRALREVPKKTGRLARSLKATGLVSGGKVFSQTGVVYAAVIHWGVPVAWPRRPWGNATPGKGYIKQTYFLWDPAQDMGKDGTVERVVENKIQGAINKYGLGPES